MGTILLTGIPRVGKSELIEVTNKLSREFYEKPVHPVSLGKIVGEMANDLWNTPPERLPFLGYELQEALRKAAIFKAINELRIIPKEDHVVIDTPLSMFVQEGSGRIPDAIFTQHDIERLHDARTIDHTISLIEAPHIMADRLRDTPYPTDEKCILDWTSIEAALTKRNSPYTNPPRTIIIPRKHSDETLAKLLQDPTGPVCYFAGPITGMNKGAMDAIEAFKSEMQEYSCVITPLVMTDTQVNDPQAKAHTVYRDIHWFVRYADMTIAYYPQDVDSAGTTAEMYATARLGKPVILIRPTKPNKVFSPAITLHFETKEKFFEAIATSRVNPRYQQLQCFLDPHQDTPRYAHLRNFSVAADVLAYAKDLHSIDPKIKEKYSDEIQLHLIGKRAQGRPMQNYWTLITGKRDVNKKTGFMETGTEALQGEIWQEAGLAHFAEALDPATYRLYRADFGDIPYFRVYPIRWVPEFGKPTPDNVTKYPEISEICWETPEEILKRTPIFGGTSRYFQDVIKNRKK